MSNVRPSRSHAMSLQRKRRASFGRRASWASAVCLAACGGSGEQTNVTIGGSVAGLSTEGLILSNGTDSLELHPGDGNFAFLTLVGTGATYSVQVSSQPTTRDQFCTIANGA